MSDLPSWARVGAKVVCVNDAPLPGTFWNADGPKRGSQYTIKRIFVGPRGFWSADFDELVRSASAKQKYGPDIGYRLDRFRPLVSQSDDLALFTHHLDSVRNTEHA